MPTTFVPTSWPEVKAHLRQAATAINSLLAGAHNEVHDVTMASGTTTTRYPAGTEIGRAHV